MDIKALPKAELHLHIEGTLDPAMVFALAERNDVPLPWRDAAELAALYDFADLPGFLSLYYRCMAVLRVRQDFFDLAYAYYARAAADGVRHAEVFFDPQVHLDNGATLADVIGGLRDAQTAAAAAYGITGGLILCFLRDRGPVAAAAVLEAAVPHLGDLMGVGLDSAEAGFPPEPFAAVFERAGGLGLHRVAHAGEEGPPAHIWGALDALGAERIDHGLRALEDEALVARLAGERIPLTVCPLSNVRLRAVPDLGCHPLKRMLGLGLNATVNSDDPAYFGGYLADNFIQTADALGLGDEAVAALCRNSIKASFASPERKAALLNELAAVLTAQR
ncbi:MAG: adenosine deaminase [Propionibacteriaceae bacterium]|jgi:adenosine deaminase|nr:adenosine deaminase [Propionibacteriaceae bacterium]